MPETLFERKPDNHKKQIFQVVLFLLLIIAADYATGKVLRYFYQRQKSGWEYSTMYSVERTNADVLIFGASRAQQQYNPLFIEDSLKLSCYNVGRDGSSMLYHYAVLEGVLKRYTPKIIVLDCEYGMLKNTVSSYERLSSLLPFYKDHPEMRDIIEKRSPYEKYKLLSSVYPYNSMIFKIASGNVRKKEEDIKGYLKLERSLSQPIKTYDFTKKYELDTTKVNLMERFIDDCKKKNIQLYFFCGPYYMKTIGEDYSQAVVKEIADRKKVDFIDYANLETFQTQPKYFDDTVHVNYEGSKIFSAMVASELKKRATLK